MGSREMGEVVDAGVWRDRWESIESYSLLHRLSEVAVGTACGDVVAAIRLRRWRQPILNASIPQIFPSLSRSNRRKGALLTILNSSPVSTYVWYTSWLQRQDGVEDVGSLKGMDLD